MADEEEIFAVYKKIKILNYMRTSFLQKIESGSISANPGANGKETTLSTKVQKIKEHFRIVKELEKQFHESVVHANL